MGLDTTRPDDVTEGLVEIHNLISNNKLEDALKKIDQLKQVIGDDPDLVRAEVLIKRREIIGK
jgi:hypothetical protein